MPELAQRSALDEVSEILVRLRAVEVVGGDKYRRVGIAGRRGGW